MSDKKTSKRFVDEMKQFFIRNDWPEGVEVFLDALEKFPNDPILHEEQKKIEEGHYSPSVKFYVNDILD